MVLKDEITDKKNVFVFDIDGTLLFYDTLDNLIKEALTYYNFEPIDEYIKMQNYGVFKSLSSSEHNNDFSYEQLYRYWNETLTFLKNTNVTSKMIGKLMIDLEPKYTKIIPEVSTTLNLLKGRLICSTNWFLQSQLIKLNKIGLDGYFEYIYTCEEINAKPSHLHFKYILEQENVKPNNIVMIGDSSSDLCARKEGIQTVLLDIEGNKKMLYNKADCVVTSFRDIPLVLKK